MDYAHVVLLTLRPEQEPIPEGESGHLFTVVPCGAAVSREEGVYLAL